MCREFLRFCVASCLLSLAVGVGTPGPLRSHASLPDPTIKIRIKIRWDYACASFFEKNPQPTSIELEQVDKAQMGIQSFFEIAFEGLENQQQFDALMAANKAHLSGKISQQGRLTLPGSYSLHPAKSNPNKGHLLLPGGQEFAEVEFVNGTYQDFRSQKDGVTFAFTRDGKESLLRWELEKTGSKVLEEQGVKLKPFIDALAGNGFPAYSIAEPTPTSEIDVQPGAWNPATPASTNPRSISMLNGSRTITLEFPLSVVPE